MKNKRSKGVTFFACILMIANVYQFVMGLILLLNRANGSGQIMIRLPIFLLALIMSIYLLQLKDWARVGTIIICVLGAIGTVVEVPNVLTSLRGTSQNYQSTMYPLLLSTYLFAVVFNLAPVYFFTRSKVIDQYK